jgi:hypothetical protein
MNSIKCPDGKKGKKENPWRKGMIIIPHWIIFLKCVAAFLYIYKISDTLKCRCFKPIGNGCFEEKKKRKSILHWK